MVTVLVWRLQCRPPCRGWGCGGAPVGAPCLGPLDVGELSRPIKPML